MELIQAVTWEIEFSTANHLHALREERCDGHKNRDDANDAKIEGASYEPQIT